MLTRKFLFRYPLVHDVIVHEPFELILLKVWLKILISLSKLIINNIKKILTSKG